MWYVTPHDAGLSIYYTPPPHVYFPLVAHSGECLEISYSHGHEP